MTTWTDLLDPGSADNFFNPPPENTPFDGSAREYNDVNAWWLMELSRLVYCRDDAARTIFLGRAGLREIAFIDAKDTECFVVAPAAGAAWAALVFRGTENIQDWLINARLKMGPWLAGGNVHEGFRDALATVWERVQTALQEVANAPLFLSGHSLGAALATLAASELRASGRLPVATYTYGSPYVGDAAFGTTLDLQHLYRVVNDRDVVSTVPPPFPPLLDYVHHGVLHKIGASNPPHNILDHPAFAAILGLVRRLVTLEIFRTAFEVWAKAFLGALDPPPPLADHAPINYVNLLGGAAHIPPRVPVP